MEKLSKAMQPKVKEVLHNIWSAETRESAEKAYQDCLERFSSKYPKTMNCLAAYTHNQSNRACIFNGQIEQYFGQFLIK